MRQLLQSCGQRGFFASIHAGNHFSHGFIHASILTDV
jgi:hypothetical protein